MELALTRPRRKELTNKRLSSPEIEKVYVALTGWEKRRVKRGRIYSPALFYQWLVEHPRLGPWIRDYLDGNGILLKSKGYAIRLIWASILFSCYLVQRKWGRICFPVPALKTRSPVQPG
ncbi:DUF454 family protein [Pseudomonas sp. B7]|uniref:Uncharacterized protein n=1 Tax=Pseudomonas fluorescens (strain Pf0-1) TaxID=205922 RepID=Q3KG99_PSEPF|nr:conserved hypothetical protein [Pseudomonas fluorescens Pf0-1]MBL0797788.1 DUF454 family protein [Pseudomonas sp. B7]MBX8622746.1 DUF454 family protein [Pseudomonas glycinae]MBY9027162.1 DUF454 family protein [Pseudomonas fluorescens]MBY9032857.1 DUF454 family protein [Pseudomonas fluorescens]